MSTPTGPYQKMMVLNVVICILLFLFPLLPLAQGWDPTVAGLMLLPAVVWLSIVLRMWWQMRKSGKR